MRTNKRKPIHRAEPGDLVRHVGWVDYERYPHATRPTELFMIMDVQGPDNCRDRAIKTHEMTLVIWEVSEPSGHHSHVPMNLYEIATNEDPHAESS
jgi:hypothetical protein